MTDVLDREPGWVMIPTARCMVWEMLNMVKPSMNPISDSLTTVDVALFQALGNAPTVML